MEGGRPAQSRKSAATCSITGSHSPSRACRNTRVRGYHRESDRIRPQRQSGRVGSRVQHGLASAPAKCTVLFAGATTRSTAATRAASPSRSTSGSTPCAWSIGCPVACVKAARSSGGAPYCRDTNATPRVPATSRHRLTGMLRRAPVFGAMERQVMPTSRAPGWRARSPARRAATRSGSGTIHGSGRTSPPQNSASR